MLEFNDATFDDQVLKSAVPVLVDFGAEWCGPCKASKPHVQALAQQAVGFRVGYVDIDRAPVTASRCAIRSVPTFAVFVRGRAVAKHVGIANTHDLLELLRQAGESTSS